MFCRLFQHQHGLQEGHSVFEMRMNQDFRFVPRPLEYFVCKTRCVYTCIQCMLTPSHKLLHLLQLVVWSPYAHFPGEPFAYNPLDGAVAGAYMGRSNKRVDDHTSLLWVACKSLSARALLFSLWTTTQHMWMSKYQCSVRRGRIESCILPSYFLTLCM